MADRLVLALDGSTRTCCAALLRIAIAGASETERPTVVGRSWRNARRRTAGGRRGSFCTWSTRCFAQRVGAPQDLGAIVVGIGPGTFTGVRIAVATARALSLALDVPVLGCQHTGGDGRGRGSELGGGRRPWSHASGRAGDGDPPPGSPGGRRPPRPGLLRPL